MDKTQNRQFQENIEIGELKRELVKAENEHQLSIQREDALHAELEDLSKTSKELNSEIDMLRKHQLDILEPQLVAGIKELQLDVMQRRAQIENLQKDFDEKQGSESENGTLYCIALIRPPLPLHFSDAVHALTTEKSTAEVTKEKHISLYSKASELPAKLQKQSEVFREGITLLAIEATKLASLLAQLDRDQEKMLKRKHEVEDLSLTLRAEFERRRMEMDQVEMESENIHKAHQLAKEQLFVQREEKVKLELAHKKALMDVGTVGERGDHDGGWSIFHIHCRHRG